MKNIFLTTVTFLLAIVGLNAANLNYNRAERPFVFNENGIEFAVFSDGQFDFNVLAPTVGVHIDTRFLDFSFNTGHNYDAFVQYDAYGAPIQIENTPIYYDFYGRVSQIGSVNLFYNRFGYVNQIGNMFVNYNPAGYFIGTRGYINRFNRNVVFQSRFNVYCRPRASRIVLHNTPYRRDFRPVRRDYRTFRRNYVAHRPAARVARNFRRPGAKAVVNNRRNVNNRVVVNNRGGNKKVVTKTVTTRNNNNRNYSPRNNNQRTTRVTTTRTTTNNRGGNVRNNGRTTKVTTTTTKKYNNKAAKTATRTNRSSRAVASNDNRTYRRR